MLGSGSQEMDTTMNATPILTAILALLLSGNSIADELADAANALCDTIKTCALETVGGPDLSEQLRQQMEPALENNCAQMRGRVQAVPSNHPLHQPAISCLHSMASLSCLQLYDSSEFKTPECMAYERLSKAASTMTP